MKGLQDDGAGATAVEPPAELSDGDALAVTTGKPAARPPRRREHVRLDALRPNPWQPRVTIDQGHVREMADSIASVGLLQCPLARPAGDGMYELAFGHVRVEAVRLLAGEGRWPWPTLEVDVRPLVDREMAFIALAENAKRKDLAPLEMYRAWRKALEIEGMTQEGLAEVLGIARPTLSNALRVLALPAVVLDRVDSGELSVHGAREMLCLQEADHAHLDIMEAVVREIAGSTFGVAPDWRTGNIRRKIMYLVARRLTGEWRHLSTSRTEAGGVHGGYVAEFDVVAFGEAFPRRVHTIPHDEPDGRGKYRERGLAWTCEPREWKRWQDRAKATAQRAMPGVRDTSADKDLLAALKRDPVARKLMAAEVSEETIARAAVERRAPKEEAADDERMRDVAAGYRRLNARMGALVQGLMPNTLAWSSLHTVEMAERLCAEMALGEYGLDTRPVYRALGEFIGAIEEEVAGETAAQAHGMTEEVRAALGSRGEAALDLGKTKAWYTGLGVGDYKGPPKYFPDVKECLERCVIGARYAKEEYGGGIRLVCTNEAHFKEKLEAGKAIFAKRVEAEKERMAARDRPIVQALEERFDAAGALAVATALLAGGNWSKVRPWGEVDSAFDPPALEWAREALGIPPEKPWQILNGGMMMEALARRPEQATMVAACLTVGAIGTKAESALAVVAERLGVAMEQDTQGKDGAKPAKGGKRAKAAKKGEVGRDESQ